MLVFSSTIHTQNIERDLRKAFHLFSSFSVLPQIFPITVKPFQKRSVNEQKWTWCPFFFRRFVPFPIRCMGAAWDSYGWWWFFSESWRISQRRFLRQTLFEVHYDEGKRVKWCVLFSAEKGWMWKFREYFFFFFFVFFFFSKNFWICPQNKEEQGYYLLIVIKILCTCINSWQTFYMR